MEYDVFENLEFSNICRTCLSKDRTLKQIFEIENADEVKFITMLKECTSIQISVNDDLPKALCEICVNQVFSYYEFRKQSLLSENKLLNIVQRKQKETFKTELPKSVNKEEIENEIQGENSSDYVNHSDFFDSEQIDIKPDIHILKNDTDKIDCKEKKSKYKCEICELNFAMKKEFLNHNRDKHVERKFKCDECDKTFVVAGVLRNHKLTHGVNCLTCFRRFKNVEELEEHSKEHGNSDKYVCQECGKEFEKRKNLTKHLKIHTGKKSYLCIYCGRTFTLSANLRAHLRVHNGTRPYTCEYCNKRFKQWSTWSSHLIAHKIGNDNRERTHVCSECGKGFYQKENLRKHMNRHADVREYSCTICPKQFKSSQELKRHLNTHTGEKMFTCTYCDKSFNRKSNLTVHIRVHTNERPHVCTICNRSFIQRKTLIVHMKTHKTISTENQDIM